MQTKIKNEQVELLIKNIEQKIEELNKNIQHKEENNVKLNKQGSQETEEQGKGKRKNSNKETNSESSKTKGNKKHNEEVSDGDKEKTESKQSVYESASVIFICDRCDFETTTSSNLKSHTRSKHTIEKLYKCEECEYKTREKDQLREHKQLKHRNRPISCKECDFQTNSQETLEKHMKVAMGHKNKSICRYYQNNRCRFGKFCKFQHSEVLAVQKTKTKSHISKQCRQYENCRDFPSCRFEHREICKYQMSCRNFQCSYVHLEQPFLGRWMRSQNSI